MLRECVLLVEGVLPIAELAERHCLMGKRPEDDCCVAAGRCASYTGGNDWLPVPGTKEVCSGPACTDSECCVERGTCSQASCAADEAVEADRLEFLWGGVRS